MSKKKMRYCQRCYLIQPPQGWRDCIHCEAPPEIAWGLTGNYIYVDDGKEKDSADEAESEMLIDEIRLVA